MNDQTLLTQLIEWYKHELSSDSLRVSVGIWLMERGLLPKSIRILKVTKTIPAGEILPVAIETDELIVVYQNGIAYGFSKDKEGSVFEYVGKNFNV